MHAATFTILLLSSQALAVLPLGSASLAPEAVADTALAAEVRFTNPLCPSRPYLGYFEPQEESANPLDPGFRYTPPRWIDGGGQPIAVPLRDGTTRSATPEGVYCFQQDADASTARPDGVFAKISQVIGGASQGDSISISTFSFSEKRVAKLLCDAMGRGAKVTIVYGSDSTTAAGLAGSGCPAGPAKVIFAGGEGQSRRLQHSKYILLDQPSQARSHVVFQSANFTSGVSLHHENWNFVELPSSDPFVVSHRCHFGALESAHFNDPAHLVTGFRAAFQSCLGNSIPPGSQSALAIKPYFVPAQSGELPDGRAASEDLLAEVRSADAIDVISHHLTFKPLLAALLEAISRGSTVRILMDDEIFWVGNSALPRDSFGKPRHADANGTALTRDDDGVSAYDHYPTVALFQRGCSRGASFSLEAYEALVPLFAAGAQVRYVEANHRESLFQHNKFVVTHRAGKPHSVFSGAGNLSSAGFLRNGENFYLIRQPEMVQAYAAQYDKLWNTMATPPEKLPVTWATQVDGDTRWESWKRRILETKKKCQRNSP